MSEEIVDFKFPIKGNKISKNYEHHLHSALSFIHPIIKSRTVGIHPIGGEYQSSTHSILIKENSFITLRTNIENTGKIKTFMGKEIPLHDDKIKIADTMSLSLLKPCESLYSKIVIKSGIKDINTFLEYLFVEMKKIGIYGLVHCQEKNTKKAVSPLSQNIIKRTIRINNANIPGFPLFITNLSPEDSLKIQQHGLGAKRSMCCGIFIPSNI